MGDFIERESYLHKTAKELLSLWLTESNLGLPYAKNTGIFTELKFYETSTPYYFESIQHTGKILFVPDITVFHKGRAYILIEVVHTSELCAKKLRVIQSFFNDYPIFVYTINALSIVRLTEKPKTLNFQIAIDNGFINFSGVL